MGTTSQSQRFMKSHKLYFKKGKKRKRKKNNNKKEAFCQIPDTSCFWGFFSHPSFFYISSAPSPYLFLFGFLPLGAEQAIKPGLNMPQKNSSLDMAKILVSNETKQKTRVK